MSIKNTCRAAAVSCLVFLAGCGGSSGTDEWVATGKGVDVQAATPVKTDPGEVTTPTGEPIAGGELNKFFPDSGGEFGLIYKQEKEGFAQANLSKDSVEVASLSISDMRSNPQGVEKYRDSSEMIGGFPSAAMGSQGTGVLVGSRFQVSVRSLDSSFTADDRRAWLQKFDLNGLSQIR